MYQIWKIVVESLDGNITKILEMSNDRILFVTGVNEFSDKKSKQPKGFEPIISGSDNHSTDQ